MNKSKQTQREQIGLVYELFKVLFFSSYKAPPNREQLLDDLVSKVIRVRLGLFLAGTIHESVLRLKTMPMLTMTTDSGF